MATMLALCGWIREEVHILLLVKRTIDWLILYSILFENKENKKEIIEENVCQVCVNYIL